MEMNKKFDVGAALKAGGIVPRDEPYDTEEIQQALNIHLGQGKYVQLHCLTDRVVRIFLIFYDFCFRPNKPYLLTPVCA